MSNSTLGNKNDKNTIESVNIWLYFFCEVVAGIETVKTFQLSQQQKGTDTDWENLGLTNPNNPD